VFLFFCFRSPKWYHAHTHSHSKDNTKMRSEHIYIYIYVAFFRLWRYDEYVWRHGIVVDTLYIFICNKVSFLLHTDDAVFTEWLFPASVLSIDRLFVSMDVHLMNSRNKVICTLKFLSLTILAENVFKWQTTQLLVSSW